jgi:tetratricopeptide (TPR) repeat protein
MPTLTTSVFIASRFREFLEIRTALTNRISEARRLHIEPINLDDGRVSHEPPLSIRLANVRRSDFLILLLGETYGNPAPNSSKSYTHLEYEEAVRPDSNTEVLVFCVGKAYNNRSFPASNDPKLARWYRHLEEHHTVGFVDPDKSPHEIAEKIFEELFHALYERRSLGKLNIDTIDQETSLTCDEKDFAEDWSELESLEAKDMEAKGIPLLGDEILDPQLQPAAVAAREQRQEAQRAIDIGDYASAIKHLDESLNRRPVDFISCYWLAQLLVALRKKDQYLRITQLLRRAANLAKHDNSSFREAACHILWARAASMSGQHEEALKQAKEAVDLCPKFSRTHIELARQLVMRGQKSEAVQSLKEAFFVYAPTFKENIADPAFRPIRERVQEELHEEVSKDVTSLLDAEMRLLALANKPEAVTGLLADILLSKCVQAGRNSVRRQYELVCEIVTRTANTLRELRVLEREMALADSQRNNIPSSESKMALIRARQNLRLAVLRRQVAEGALASWRQNPLSRRGVGFLSAAAGALAVAISAICIEATSLHFTEATLALSLLLGAVGAAQYTASSRKLRSELERARSRERVEASAVAAMESARQIFENETLHERALWVPFPRLRRTAQPGDVVRVKQAELKQRPEVSVVDDIPSVLPEDEGGDNHWRLYKVLEKDAEKITISGMAAYLKGQSFSAGAGR